MKYILLFLFSTFTLYSQSIIITDVDETNYPNLKLDFMVLDANGSAVDFDNSKLSVNENGIDKLIESIECNEDYKKEPISLALTIDVSTSMNDTISLPSTRRIDVIKNAAKKLVAVLHPDSEITLVLFSTEVNIIVPLTTERNIVTTKIDEIDSPYGSTYISEAFLDENEGILKSLEGASYPKIIAFMTDGRDNDLEKVEISKELQNNNITLYSLSADSYLELELIEITEKSGGLVFNNIKGAEEIEDSFLAMGNIMSGISACQLNYLSEGCDNKRTISLKYNDKYEDKANILLNKENLVEYNILNNKQKKGPSTLESNYYYVNIQSNKNGLEINSISPNNSNIKLISPIITEFSLFLNEGDILNLQFEISPTDKKINDFVRINSNSCIDGKIYIKYEPDSAGLTVLEPNGGEEYYIGSNANLVWKDDGFNSTYNLSYSTDMGENWKVLVEDYNGEDFPWQNIPEPQTDEALFKVSKNITVDSIVKTVGIETLESKITNEIISITPYLQDNFLALAEMQTELKFSNLDLHYTDFGLDIADSLANIKILMILNNKLEVVKYKPIIINSLNSFLREINGSPYVIFTNFSEISIDTLNYTTPNLFNANYGIILKLDTELDLVEYKNFNNYASFSNFNNLILDFEVSKDNLHLLGTFKETLNFDGKRLLSTSYTNDDYFLMKLDTNLEYQTLLNYEIKTNNFDFIPEGIESINNDSIAWWGNGFGKFFNLDSINRGISAISSYQHSSLDLSNYMEIEKTFDYRFIDFKLFADREFWLYYAIDTIRLKNNSNIIPHDIYNTSLLSFDEIGEIEWSVLLDKFGVNKHLTVFDKEEIVVGGLTNSTFIVDKYTITKDGNTQFISSFDLFTGQFKWIKYVPETTYKGLLTANNSAVALTGNIYRKTDFGNGFLLDKNGGLNNNKYNYLWSLGVDNNTYFDISDSLWSIRSKGFDYIDTVDFGNVYSGSIKDTIVVDFFSVNDIQDSVIIENIDIENVGYTVEKQTPFKLTKNTDIKIILNIDFAGGGLAKGVITTNIGVFNFYVTSNEITGKIYQQFYNNDSIAIDFGEVFIGEKKDETINIIANLGLANIGIDSIKVLNNNGNNFSYNIISDKSIIYSQDTLVSNFTFAPKLTGIHKSEFLFFTDVTRYPFVINVTGIGISNDTIDVNITIDSSQSDADKYVELTTQINLNENPESLQLNHLEIDIEYNATLLIPFRFENAGKVENKIRKLTLRVDKEEIQNGISNKRFYTTIGNSISTDIDIISVRAYNSNNDEISELNFTTSNGYFELSNVCYSDGKYRLFNISEPTDLKIYYENGEYFVNYNLIEDGFTNISIFGTDGKLIKHLINKNMNKGTYSTEVDTKNIANGSYIIQLETENIVLSKILVIVK